MPTTDTRRVPPPAACLKPGIGPSPLRRLTHTEYNYAVTDLLGDKTHPASAFPPDTQEELFDNMAETQAVPVLLAGHYVDAAVKLANGIGDVPALVGCDLGGAEGAACTRGFIQRFGRRAYRRPVTPEEITRLTAVFDSAGADKQTGVRAVVAAILSSPHFLFRLEVGAADSELPGAKRLSSFELAGRLAALLWSSVPDDVLLDAAQAGTLGTREQVATQARRMLADPRAKRVLSAFYDQWLGLSLTDVVAKDKDLFPDFNDALRAAMREETRRFVESVVWDGDGKLSTLLQAPYSFVNPALARLYAVKGPTDAASFSKVTFDAKQRLGVLTQASFLTAYAGPDESSPVRRGKWVRQRLLCGDLPPPPNEVPVLPAPKEGVSNRERLRMHDSQPACSGCHQLIDGIGLGLEHYDAIGRLRDRDQGLPVDSSGEINNTRDINGKFDGAAELAALLARSADVRDCAPTQFFRYSMGRREVPEDACSLETLREQFTGSGGNLRELLVAVTQTDAFLNFRRAQ